MKAELKQLIIDKISDLRGQDIHGCDLHHEIFNTDYFIIGTYEATEWLESNIGIFEAIRTVRDYEEFNFGASYTDISNPEKLCNMFVYIIGEEILSEIKHLNDVWDNILTNEDYDLILEEL